MTDVKEPGFLVHCVNNIFWEASNAKRKGGVFLAIGFCVMKCLVKFIGLVFLFHYSIHVFLSLHKYFGSEIELVHL